MKILTLYIMLVLQSCCLIYVNYSSFQRQKEHEVFEKQRKELEYNLESDLYRRGCLDALGFTEIAMDNSSNSEAAQQIDAKCKQMAEKEMESINR